MKNLTLLRWIAFVVALAAVASAAAMLAKHATDTSDPGLLSRICGGESSGCDEVIASRYGYFPFAPETAEPTPGTASEIRSTDDLRKGRIPVAALGLFYYTFLAVYLGLIGSPSWPVRRLHSVVLGVVAVGLIGSFVFLGIMWGAIGKTCTLCLASHICNFILAFLVWKLRPVEPRFPEEGGGLVKPVLPFPDTRLGATAALLVVSLCFGEFSAYRALLANTQIGHYDEAMEQLKSLQAGTIDTAALVAENEGLKTQVAQLEGRLATAGPTSAGEVAQLPTRVAELEAENDDLRERLRALEADVDILDASFMEQDKLEIAIRDDDPKLRPATFGPKNRTGYYMQVVVFGDVECPNCHKFHEFLEKELIPEFNGHLEVIYKHYVGKSHAEGLKGAKALEAARLQGNEFFWKMHDYLHARFDDLAAVDYTAAAQEIGLDLQRFIADMGSSQVSNRLNADMRHAVNDLKIGGTPAVFLNKRPVSRAIRTNIGFWRIHATKLKGTRERVGQPW